MRVAAGCKGAGGHPQAGRGFSAIWSRCRWRPQSRQDRRDSTQGQLGPREVAAAAGAPAAAQVFPAQPCPSVEPPSAASRPPRSRSPCPAGEGDQEGMESLDPDPGRKEWKEASKEGWVGAPQNQHRSRSSRWRGQRGDPLPKSGPRDDGSGPPTQRTKLWGCPPLPSFLGPLKDAPACLQLSLHSQLQGNPWIADTCQWGAATGRTFWGASFGAPQTDPFSLCVVFSPPSPQEPAGSGHFLQV